MKTITLQFSTGKGLVSWIIRMRTDSTISHVDAVREDGKLVGARFHEKDGNGVQIREPNYGNFTHIEQVTFPVTDDEYTAFWAFLNSQVGKPYDWRAIVGLGFHRDWRSDDSWFCSEVIARAIEVAHISVVDQNVNWIDPQSLRMLAMAFPAATKKVIK